MNVLKKDIFSKPGAKSKQRKTDYSNFTAVNHSSRNLANALPFLQRQTVEDEATSHLSQISSASVSSSSGSLSSSFTAPAKTFFHGRNLDFEDVMQPFIDECQESQQPQVADSSDVHIFKKPRPIASGEKSMDHGESTSDVLRVLGESSTSDQSNKHCPFSDLTFRVPQNQGEDIFPDGQQVSPPSRRLVVVDRQPVAFSPASGRVSPLSSIRANNSTVSSDKKTPRPQTGKSPKTPKTSSTTVGGPSDSDVSSCIIAVTEGRGHASGEVGIAAMDPRRPHLVLCQISDSQRYSHSLSKMNLFNFTEAIVPNTFVDGPAPRKLYLDILDRFPSVTVNHVQRRHFSEAAGLQMIQQYCSRESESVMVVVKDKFYALAAAAALLKYIEFTQSVLIAAKSLHIEYQGTDGTTIIDLDTANRLELVMGLLSREETHSLLGVLKHCRTKGGLRLLRANLLQPPTEPARINTRLDCVTELIQNPILFNAVESVISQMRQAESLLSLCMHPPQQSGLKAAQFQLRYTLLLKTTLELVPTLSTALQEANSEYFGYVRENLGDARLGTVLSRVLQTVVEGTVGARPGPFNQLHACFMIRAGINGLLDIAKKTYCEIAQEVADLVNALKEKLNLPMRLSFSSSKGYHIQISPLDRLPTDDLPPELILVQKSRNSLTCYTNELVALDQRCQQALHEIELMTNVLLFELLNDIRGEISCLFPLCECLAELDVCLAFAHVGAAEGYVRPSFGEELRLCDARHPVLDATAKERVVANDVYADAENNFVILTGPNQSGKSIYIRQIALLQVMAQVGCYVPAKEASFRIADRIFSRIGFDDSIETNASTLMVEMQDMEFIRNNMTASSLVIVDELCRGTSVDEGTCLAFVLCEELLDTSAFVFFTTHFFFLTKLQEMYCNVRNFHFETQLAAEGQAVLRFTHRMLVGVTPAEQYGIRLAELMGFPPSVLATARAAAQKLLAERKPQPEVCGLTARYEISKQLRMNLPQGDATWAQVLPVIRHYKSQYEALPAEDELLTAMLQNVHIQPTAAVSSEEQVLSDSERGEDLASVQTREHVRGTGWNETLAPQELSAVYRRKETHSTPETIGQNKHDDTVQEKEVHSVNIQMKEQGIVPFRETERSENQGQGVYQELEGVSYDQYSLHLSRSSSSATEVPIRSDINEMQFHESPRGSDQCEEQRNERQEKHSKERTEGKNTLMTAYEGMMLDCRRGNPTFPSDGNEYLFDLMAHDKDNEPCGHFDMAEQSDCAPQVKDENYSGLLPSTQKNESFVSPSRDGSHREIDEEPSLKVGSHRETVEEPRLKNESPRVADEEPSLKGGCHSETNEEPNSSVQTLNEEPRDSSLVSSVSDQQNSSESPEISQDVLKSHLSGSDSPNKLGNPLDLQKSFDDCQVISETVNMATVQIQADNLGPIYPGLEENSERTCEAALMLLKLCTSSSKSGIPELEAGPSRASGQQEGKKVKVQATTEGDQGKSKKRKARTGEGQEARKKRKKSQEEKKRQKMEAMLVREARKKQRKEEAAVKKKPLVDEVLRDMSATLPPVADRAAYYEWKYSRNKKALQTVAVASRGSPMITIPARTAQQPTQMQVLRTPRGFPFSLSSVSTPLATRSPLVAHTLFRDASGLHPSPGTAVPPQAFTASPAPGLRTPLGGSVPFTSLAAFETTGEQRDVQTLSSSSRDPRCYGRQETPNN